jgi:hypothetical protein
LSNCEIAPFDEPAADRFESPLLRRIRIGTMDFKIAFIAVGNDALASSLIRR